MMTNFRNYTELSMLKTFEERFQYLQLKGSVGECTFGFDRFLNQRFYRSAEWKRIRDQVIVRDHGCDLGIDGREIFKNVIIHHMNPIRQEDLEQNLCSILDPEYLISTTHRTHNAIHYGDDTLLSHDPVERSPYDTCPWKMN